MHTDVRKVALVASAPWISLNTIGAINTTAVQPFIELQCRCLMLLGWFMKSRALRRQGQSKSLHGYEGNETTDRRLETQTLDIFSLKPLQNLPFESLSYLCRFRAAPEVAAQTCGHDFCVCVPHVCLQDWHLRLHQGCL